MSSWTSLGRKALFGVALAGSLQATSANAALIEYASAVAGTSGSFSGSATNTLGAPDGLFIQLAFGSSITLDFGSSLSPTSVQLIFTIDDIAPAFADIAVSNDNSSFTNLGNTGDANGTPGSVSFGVNVPFRYVRVTDDGLGDPRFPTLGFDLDAVGRTTAVPLPAALPLFASGLGVLGLLGWRRRRAV